MARRPVRKLSLGEAVVNTAKKLARTKARSPGAIQFELSGRQGGAFEINVDRRLRVTCRKGPSRRKPRIRIVGSDKNVRMVLEGKRDARKAFFAGGLQVRGDIRYLERLLEDLKLMKPAG